jgi:hypothetical protein
VPEGQSLQGERDASRPGAVGRGPAVLAWSLCALGIGGLIAGAVLENMSGQAASSEESLPESLALLFGFAALPAMGAFVASHHPRNPMGWLFLAVGAGIGLLLISTAYAHWALVDNTGSYPLVTLAAWFEQWLWGPCIGLLFTLVLLLFPDGKPPSPRWNWLVWVGALLLGVISVGGMVEERLESDAYSIDNPIGIPGLGDVESTLGPLFALLVPLVALCVASLVVRFRRSRGDERQQLKLVTFAASLSVVSVVAGEFFEVPGTFAVMLLLIVGSVAIAMLKYRLYDIDRIINKTAVYGLLTAMLVACYVIGVPLIQSVLPLPEDSPASVAASTLGIAALFAPLRRRVQTFVDRRFYRSRYDAIKTIDLFGANLRRHTDLDDLTSELVRAVRRTVHPSHVSVVLVDGKETA